MPKAPGGGPSSETAGKSARLWRSLIARTRYKLKEAKRAVAELELALAAFEKQSGEAMGWLLAKPQRRSESRTGRREN